MKVNNKKDKKKEKDGKKQSLQCPYLTVDQIFEEYDTSSNGLTGEEAERRLEEYGKNELPGKKKVSIWRVIFNQIKSPLIYIDCCRSNIYCYS